MNADRPLVIGIGNEHRGDDAAGLLVVRELRDLGVATGQLELVEHRGDGASLLELWRGRSRVILVDALHSDEPPGRVVRLEVGDRPLEVERELGSTHAFGVGGAIEMARGLGRLPQHLEVYGIVGDVFTMGAAPQPAIIDAAHAVAKSLTERFAWP